MPHTCDLQSALAFSILDPDLAVFHCEVRCVFSFKKESPGVLGGPCFFFFNTIFRYTKEWCLMNTFLCLLLQCFVGFDDFGRWYRILVILEVFQVQVSARKIKNSDNGQQQEQKPSTK